MFGQRIDQCTSVVLLITFLLMSVVSSETSLNVNGNPDVKMTNSENVKQNSPEQVEFVNLSPSNINGRLGKLFELDNGDFVDESLSRPSLSVLRPLPKFSNFYRPIRPLSSINPNYQFIGDNVMSEARARRYVYPKGQNSQSFLRFGRAYDSALFTQKRPMKTKDTAFLRFGRSQL